MACTVARMACTAPTQMAPCSCCNCKSETANETAIAGPRLTNADEIREFQELVLNKRAAQLQRYVLRQPVLKNTILDNLVLGMENGIPHWGYTMNCPNLLASEKMRCSSNSNGDRVNSAWGYCPFALAPHALAVVRNGLANGNVMYSTMIFPMTKLSKGIDAVIT